MDTSNLKKFAVEARKSLRKGVDDCLKGLGFDQNGHVEEDDRPRAVDGGCIWRGNFISDNDFFDKWTALENAIVNHEGGAKVGYKAVVEEAGYTWFNRFVAIRILQKNKLIEPQLVYLPGTRVPMIVENARRGIVPEMGENDQNELKKILQDHSKVLEQFNLLIVAFCHSTPILSKCFGHINDYTELLLPQNVLAMGGFIDLLNNTSYLTDDDFAQTELIGWLYQFYISEKKDEVFANFKNKKKAEADDIPAATQIFTPNWIVKYMVQNTLGRIYLDNKPSSDLASKWKYLVDKSGSDDGAIYKFSELEQLKVADFACGSGHILNEFFDMLYDFYLEDGASAKEAIECIFKYNLIGIDLDTRAKQLSMFSLLLKACQKRAEFVDAQMLPRVFDMPDIKMDASTTALVKKYIEPTDAKWIVDQVIDAMKLMESAKNLGATMKFDFKIPGQVKAVLKDAVVHAYEVGDKLSAEIGKAFELILVLTDKYSAIAMNPPYMGNGNMNDELKGYLADNYPDAKYDLFATFMELMMDRCDALGRAAAITMESWMFLSSYEKLRQKFLDKYFIASLGHFGWHIIGIAFGTAMCVWENAKSGDRKGEYSYLTIDDIDQEKNVPFEFPKKDNGRYAIVPQSNFEQIPGSPIGYWVSEKVIKSFVQNCPLLAVCKPTQGLATADNGRFVRHWHEVSLNKIGFNFKDTIEANFSNRKWFPYNKGGEQRKWYGNQNFVVNWEHDGFELKTFKGAVIRNPTYYFHQSISWGLITGQMNTFRFFPKGFIYDVAGMSIFPQEGIEFDEYEILGLLNTKYYTNLSKLINPSVNLQCGDVSKFPYLPAKVLSSISRDCVFTSKSDWDAHETSWDFQKNELLAMDAATDDVKREPQQPNLLEWRMDVYESKWERLFYQLHENEVELNRQFIEIYGLQDELTPEVPYDEVTILQQGEINVVGDRIEFNRDAIIKQFVSYAVGCMMGRYRLDKEGLAIAHPGATAEEIAAYEYNGETWQIDDDGILPLMGRESGFADDATSRFKDFIRVAFGEENQNKNLSFVDQCLGKSVEDYFTKDFWADHKKMYQNRPIYWLFSSKKGAFKCIAYMHRMDKNTVEQIRQKYLLKYIDKLRNEEAALLADSANLSGADQKKLTKIQKNLKECEEYHVILHDIADKRIEFDLDDGVVVNYAKFGEILAKIK